MAKGTGMRCVVGSSSSQFGESIPTNGKVKLGPEDLALSESNEVLVVVQGLAFRVQVSPILLQEERGESRVPEHAYKGILAELVGEPRLELVPDFLLEL